MKRILRVLFLIGPCLFLFTRDVHALAQDDITTTTVNYNVPFGTYIDNFTTFKDLNTGTIYNGHNLENGFFNNDLNKAFSYIAVKPYNNFNLSNNGMAIAQCNLGLKKDNYYVLSYYYLTYSADLMHPWYGSTADIGIGNSHTNALNNMNIVALSTYSGANYYNFYPGYYLQISTTVFKADKDATCVAYGVNAKSHNMDAFSIEYVGYRLEYSGIDAPTSSDIQSIVKQEAQTINDNIDSMKEKQDKTNELIESEDDDTTSKKCGMLCKLKGIFTGIIELPGKLVNLLIDALKSLFIPTDEQLYNIINKAQDLTENFGFVGESMNFFINIFTSLLGLVNANGCIELPEFTIGATSLFEAHTFWNAQQVCLNDNPILSNNIDTIRTITSIALVCLFINFAASKFFSILSKNDNEVTSGIAASTRGEV